MQRRSRDQATHAVRHDDETFDRLLIEPLIASRYLPSTDCSVIDVGSGGGSPAIPLKLAMPGISLRMVESKTRKAAFLREAVRRLVVRPPKVVDGGPQRRQLGGTANTKATDDGHPPNPTAEGRGPRRREPQR